MRNTLSNSTAAPMTEADLNWNRAEALSAELSNLNAAILGLIEERNRCEDSADFGAAREAAITVDVALDRRDNLRRIMRTDR